MKVIQVIVIVLMFFISNSCFAMNMSKEQFIRELSLGGICLNTPYSEIVKIYGQPTRVEKGTAQLVSYIIYYGDSVQIVLDRTQERKAIGITTTSNNGWNTPSGIHVGMLMKNFVNLYGEPTNIEQPSHYRNWPTYVYRDTETIPAGYGVNGMKLELTINRGLDIEWDKNGDRKIKSIHVWKEEYDPVPVLRRK